MKKFIALFDLHFGWENDGSTTRPTHNLKLLENVYKFIEDFKPDTIILGGDQLNCGPVSHWNRSKPRLTEGFRLKNELDLLYNKVILEPLIDYIPEKHWLTGNHEAWVEDFVNENPSVDGLVSIKEYLGLDSGNYNWKVHKQGHILKLGKLHFTHGDTLLGRGGYVNPAEQLLKQTRVNIRCGHLHSYYVATDFNPIRSSDYHTGIVVPCMCSTNPFYLKGRPNKWLNGFLYGYVYPNGNFNDFVVICNNNKFIAEGKEY